jgi:hypothetical protein
VPVFIDNVHVITISLSMPVSVQILVSAPVTVSVSCPSLLGWSDVVISGWQISVILSVLLYHRKPLSMNSTRQNSEISCFNNLPQATEMYSSHFASFNKEDEEKVELTKLKADSWI